MYRESSGTHYAPLVILTHAKRPPEIHPFSMA